MLMRLYSLSELVRLLPCPSISSAIIRASACSTVPGRREEDCIAHGVKRKIWSAAGAETRGRQNGRIESAGRAANDQVGGDLANGGTALDSEASLTRKPEKSRDARIGADYRDRVGGECAKPGPFALQSTRDNRGRERAQTVERGGNNLVVRLSVGWKGRFLIHRAQHQAARLGREVDLIAFADDERPSAHIEAGRSSKGDDSAATGFEPYWHRTREARDRAGPCAGGVADASRRQ